jgi:hypothetical protein
MISITLGYVAAYFIVGGISPDHQKLVLRAMQSHLPGAALGLLR